MEKHLVEEIRRRFERFPASRRVSKIREFMAQSSVNEKLVKKALPKLYREVLSSSGDFSVAGSSESDRPYALCAKPR